MSKYIRPSRYIGIWMILLKDRSGALARVLVFQKNIQKPYLIFQQNIQMPFIVFKKSHLDTIYSL